MEVERIYYEGNVIELSKNEFIILRVLFENKGHCAEEDLMNTLWNSDVFVDDNTIVRDGLLVCGSALEKSG